MTFFPHQYLFPERRSYDWVFAESTSVFSIAPHSAAVDNAIANLYNR
jgi:hypothetical protein